MIRGWQSARDGVLLSSVSGRLRELQMPAREFRKTKIICLTGFMGSGKTTVGRLLARQIGWHFADVDEAIERSSGLKIPEIFERLGEPAFRAMESESLAQIVGEALETARPTVIALGGGTLMHPANAALLRQAGCTTVWLDCPVEQLLVRCSQMTNRPLFRDEASFRQLFEQRTPFYQVSDYRVESTQPPQRVVQEILTAAEIV